MNLMPHGLEDLIDFISRVPLFSAIPASQIREIAVLFENRTALKGEVICRQGEPGDSMYVIRSGRVSLYNEADGRRIYLSDLKRGDFFGEVSLLTGEPRNATIEVGLDASFYCLARSDFETILKKNKSIGLYLSRHYAKRMSLEDKGRKRRKKAPIFYAVSATGPGLGVSHFLYSVSFHICDESHKKVLVIEPHLEAEQIMEKYEMVRVECPEPKLYTLLPEKSYRARDIYWYLHQSGFGVLQLTTGFSDRLAEVLPALLEGLQESYDVVFLNLTHHLNDLERLFVRLCDRTMVLIHNTPEKINQVKSRLSALENLCGASALLGKIRVGVSHLHGEKGIARVALKERLGLSETPNIWVDRSDDAFNDRIDKTKCFPVKGARAVAREIAGIRLGLALGAGAARGWAHIGVLKVLEEAGIHIDMISGASMGALVGGIYAATASVEKMKKSTIDLFSTRGDVRRKIFDYSFPRQGILKGRKAAELVRRAVSNADFLDLKIPAYIVGVDILNGEEVLFDTGDVTDAVRASIAIPAVFDPFKYQGRWMVDGGLLNPVPVDVLHRKGADLVIGVSIEPRDGSGQGMPDRVPGIKTIVSQTISIVHGRATSNFTKKADLVVYPDVGRFAWDDFHKGYALMHAGMEACMAQIPDIRNAVFEKSRTV